MKLGRWPGRREGRVLGARKAGKPALRRNSGSFVFVMLSCHRAKMTSTSLVIIVLGWLSLGTPLTAGIVTFFGEDVNLAGDPNVATPTNSNVARANFFSNLSG